ncbi:hypothetical protein Ddye_031692 [Dipteronia dyeriana]|uniref:Uncharacterized protein ycf68 n=1 Tax=Dipteronia dyeriana TaxID=168575 RepID=A0AAD9WNZ5_9ROSI|nr:hypothetical protein Ddye_031692 [Dipteronia dyeriana]
MGFSGLVQFYDLKGQKNAKVVRKYRNDSTGDRTQNLWFRVFSLARWSLLIHTGFHVPHATRGPISVRPEETFARLRYLLGGLRPIETVYLRLSLGPHVYFTEPLSEIVPRSLRLSCGSELTRQGISLPYDRYSYDRRSPGLRSPSPLSSDVNPHTWSYDFAETCVFGKQSPRPGHCDPLCEEAPLLPKLLGYFAEFLRESCLAPLGILYLPTCVGFGYRYPFVEGRSSFSWEYSMGYFSAVAPGPDSPSVDEPCGGTLGFLGHWILTNVCVTQADILASASSTAARAASVDRLAPFIFGARALDQCPVNCCASTHFGENQLALGSSGISPLTITMGAGHARSRYLNRKEGGAEGRASDWSEVVTRHISMAYFSCSNRGFETKLLIRRIDGAIQVRPQWEKNGAPNNVSSQTKNYEIALFISFWGDGGIVPFEPFFHTFPGGLEKAAINRIFLILPSRKEELQILFPFPFRRDQGIGSSRKKNAWLINNSLLGLRPPQSLRMPTMGAMRCVYLSIS